MLLHTTWHGLTFLFYFCIIDTVTNTIVALGQMGDGDQLERAFAGATVHDMFNFLSVAIFFPIELITGYLNRLTALCVRNFNSREGEKWVGPIKQWVGPLTTKVIISNKDIIKAVAKGGSCSDFYPIVCEDPESPTKSTCSQVGLIGCDKGTDSCPAFFQADATQRDDQISGITVFIIGLVILFICLFAMVTMLQKMLLGTSTRIIYKATNINGYLAILVGLGVTILVQSSSITTSTFTPLVGMDVIRLEQMFPITLGANIGTTITALLAALLSSTEAMQVALAHLFFNISGIIVWYPIPFMRAIPLNAARSLGKATRIFRLFPVVYIVVCFLIIPFLLFGLSLLFTQGVKGLTVLGSIITVALALGVFFGIYWFKMANGKNKIVESMMKSQARRSAVQTLPDDIEMLKNRIKQLEEHTGLLPDDVEQPEEVTKDIEQDA
jgi:sodium-dependent phosphate cotransporter